MRKSFSIADDLVFAALFAITIAVITLGLMASGDHAHPLVSSAGIVVTEPSKFDGAIAPDSPDRTPLYVSGTTTPRR